MSATDPPNPLSRRLGRALVFIGCILGAGGMLTAALGGALIAAERDPSGGRGIIVNRLGLGLMFVAALLILFGLRLPWFARIAERLGRPMTESQADAPTAKGPDVFRLFPAVLTILAVLLTLPIAALPAAILGVAAFPLKILMIAWLTAIIVYDDGPARAFGIGAIFPLGIVLLTELPMLMRVASAFYQPYSYQPLSSVLIDFGNTLRWPQLCANLLAVFSGLGAMAIRLFCLLPKRPRKTQTYANRTDGS